MYHNLRMSPRPKPDHLSAGSGALTLCNWCERRGHMETCWTKFGACMICGSLEHAKDGCTKFEAGWNNFKPMCSCCGGEHLGQACGKLSNLRASRHSPAS